MYILLTSFNWLLASFILPRKRVMLLKIQLITFKIYLSKLSISTVNLSLCLTNKAHRHEGVWKSGCIDPRNFDLGERIPGNPLDSKLVGLQSRSGGRAEEKESCPYQDSNSDPSAVQPVVGCYSDSATPRLSISHIIRNHMIMWHETRKPEYWSDKRRSLLGND
jgi:hypothetical protein